LHEIPRLSQDEEYDEDLELEEAEEDARAARPKSGVVVISLREIVIFTVTDGTFSQSYLPFDAA
jgi:hypothetical protein